MRKYTNEYERDFVVYTGRVTGLFAKCNNAISKSFLTFCFFVFDEESFLHYLYDLMEKAIFFNFFLTTRFFKWYTFSK